jgi:hypothetical protein
VTELSPAETCALWLDGLSADETQAACSTSTLGLDGLSMRDFNGDGFSRPYSEIVATMTAPLSVGHLCPAECGGTCPEQACTDKMETCAEMHQAAAEQGAMKDYMIDMFCNRYSLYTICPEMCGTCAGEAATVDVTMMSAIWATGVDAITQIEHASCLTWLDGSVSLWKLSSEHLRDFAPSLQRVQGGVSIAFSTGLQSLGFLSELRSIGGDLEVNDLLGLQDLNLVALDTIRGGVSIVRCPWLQHLEGLNRLSSIGTIRVNPSCHADGTAIFSNLPLVKNVSSLVSLASVGVSITMNDMPGLTSISLPALANLGPKCKPGKLHLQSTGILLSALDGAFPCIDRSYDFIIDIAYSCETHLTVAPDDVCHQISSCAECSAASSTYGCGWCIEYGLPGLCSSTCVTHAHTCEIAEVAVAQGLVFHGCAEYLSPMSYVSTAFTGGAARPNMCPTLLPDQAHCHAVDFEEACKNDISSLLGDAAVACEGSCYKFLRDNAAWCAVNPPPEYPSLALAVHRVTQLCGVSDGRCEEWGYRSDHFDVVGDLVLLPEFYDPRLGEAPPMGREGTVTVQISGSVIPDNGMFVTLPGSVAPLFVVVQSQGTKVWLRTADRSLLPLDGLQRSPRVGDEYIRDGKKIRHGNGQLVEGEHVCITHDNGDGTYQVDHKDDLEGSWQGARPDNCLDAPGWQDGTNSNNRRCPNLNNEQCDTDTDADGITGSEACCGCGGGRVVDAPEFAERMDATVSLGDLLPATILTKACGGSQNGGVCAQAIDGVGTLADAAACTTATAAATCDGDCTFTATISCIDDYGGLLSKFLPQSSCGDLSAERSCTIPATYLIPVGECCYGPDRLPVNSSTTVADICPESCGVCVKAAEIVEDRVMRACNAAAGAAQGADITCPDIAVACEGLELYAGGHCWTPTVEEIAASVCTVAVAAYLSSCPDNTTSVVSWCGLGCLEALDQLVPIAVGCQTQLLSVSTVMSTQASAQSCGVLNHLDPESRMDSPVDTPCPMGDFCNYNDGNTGVCEPCNYCALGQCNTCGLPSAGVNDCISACGVLEALNVPSEWEVFRSTFDLMSVLERSRACSEQTQCNLGLAALQTLQPEHQLACLGSAGTALQLFRPTDVDIVLASCVQGGLNPACNRLIVDGCPNQHACELFGGATDDAYHTVCKADCPSCDCFRCRLVCSSELHTTDALAACAEEPACRAAGHEWYDDPDQYGGASCVRNRCSLDPQQAALCLTQPVCENALHQWIVDADGIGNCEMSVVASSCFDSAGATPWVDIEFGNNCNVFIKYKDFATGLVHPGLHDPNPRVLLLEVAGRPVSDLLQLARDTCSASRMVETFAAQFPGLQSIGGMGLARSVYKVILLVDAGQGSVEVQALATADNTASVRQNWYDLYVGGGGVGVDPFADPTQVITEAAAGVHGSLVFTPEVCPIVFATVTVHVRTESWASEIRWDIDGGTVAQAHQDFEDTHTELRLPVGEHTINLYSTSGHGWHGGYLEIMDGENAVVCPFSPVGRGASSQFTVPFSEQQLCGQAQSPSTAVEIFVGISSCPTCTGTVRVRVDTVPEINLLLIHPPSESVGGSDISQCSDWWSEIWTEHHLLHAAPCCDPASGDCEELSADGLLPLSCSSECREQIWRPFW